MINLLCTECKHMEQLVKSSPCDDCYSSPFSKPKHWEAMTQEDAEAEHMELVNTARAEDGLDPIAYIDEAQFVVR